MYIHEAIKEAMEKGLGIRDKKSGIELIVYLGDDRLYHRPTRNRAAARWHPQPCDLTSDQWEAHSPHRHSIPHVTPPKDEINERELILKQIRTLEKLIDKVMGADPILADPLNRFFEISHASRTICKLLDRLRDCDE